MDTSERLATTLQNHYDGKPWYGSPLSRIADSVVSTHALRRPAQNMRSIAELLAHTVAWMEIVNERLNGADPEITPDRDFPAADSWNDVVERMRRSFAVLISTVKEKDETFWAGPAPGKAHTMEFMVDGLLHHTTYHAAQIALQNRLLREL